MKYIRLFSFIIMCQAHTYVANFESFLSILQDLSSQATSHELKSVLQFLTPNRDILDSMLVFSYAVLKHNPGLISDAQENYANIGDELIKGAIIKAVSMIPDTKLDAFGLGDGNERFKKRALSINYHFTKITYPEHLMLCFKATDDETYIWQMLKYLDVNPQEIRPQLNTKEIVTKKLADDEHKKLFISYVFFLETKRILKDNIGYPGIKEILTNIPEDIKTELIMHNLAEILDVEQDSML